MIPSVVSPIVPISAVDVIWPPLQSVQIGSAFLANGFWRTFSSTAVLWDASAGGGTNNMNLMTGANVLGGQFVNTGAAGISRTMSAVSFYVPLNKAGLPSTRFQFPVTMRTFHWQFAATTQAASVATRNMNISLMVATTGAPLISGGNAGFGLCGSASTAGNWSYFTTAGGGEEVDLGIAQTAFTLFDMVITSASGAADASFQLYVNGALVITRSWAAGTKLPTYAALVNAARLQPTIEHNDNANASVLQVGCMRVNIGQFDVNGNPVGAIG